ALGFTRLPDHSIERREHALSAMAADTGEKMHRLLRGPAELGLFLLDRACVECVDLVERQHLRLFREPVTIGFELAANGAVVGRYVLSGAVDEVQQHAAALQMRQEAVANALAFVGALD